MSDIIDWFVVSHILSDAEVCQSKSTALRYFFIEAHFHDKRSVKTSSKKIKKRPLCFKRLRRRTKPVVGSSFMEFHCERQMETSSMKRRAGQQLTNMKSNFSSNSRFKPFLSASRAFLTQRGTNNRFNSLTSLSRLRGGADQAVRGEGAWLRC